MHVIQCAGFAAPYAGSFVPMLVAIASEADARGHHTSVCLPQSARARPWLPEFEGLADLRFIEIGGGRLGSLRPTMRELRVLLDSRPGPALIHTHFTEFDMPAALMRLARRDLVVLWQEHSPLVEEPWVRLRNGLRLRCLSPLVNRILCVSPEIRTGLRARGAPADKLLDFPNAIDARRFQPITPSQREKARRSLGLDEDARVILHFGWSWERKGGDLMVAAAELLASAPGLVVLTVLGEDRTASQPALEGHGVVRALPPTNDVRSLYAAADVFLNCSRAEGMPFAVLEALACGLPVVVTDLPSQRGLLAGLPGVAIVAAEPAAIAAGIREMLALNEHQRAEHARAAEGRIRSSFALEAWAGRLVDIYDDAAGST